MLDYQSLKDLAKQIGRPVKDLVALSVGNDPFYAEVPYRRKEAEWFAEIWQRFGFAHGTHLRRIHYILLSKAKDGAAVVKPSGQPYENTDNDWAMLDHASLSARYLDMIPLDALVDRRNDAPRIFTPTPNQEDFSVSVTDTTPDAVDYLPTFPELPNYWPQGLAPEQDYLVEVWIEKSTQNDWLIPLCQERGVNLVVGVGELSEIATRGLLDRASESGKAARVIYISDFDPAGRSMPVAIARKAEFYIRKFDLDVDLTLNPLALTEEQCIDYELPRTPIKEKERRKDRFEQRFGAGATELDALEALRPGELRRLLDDEISRYIDPTLAHEVRQVELDLKRQFGEIEHNIREPHQDGIDALMLKYEQIVGDLQEWEEQAYDLWSTLTEELESEQPDFTDFEKPAPRESQEPEGFVLFDSKRDYLTQLDAYHEWQRRDG